MFSSLHSFCFVVCQIATFSAVEKDTSLRLRRIEFMFGNQILLCRNEIATEQYDDDGT